ncbi:hypothetical protein FJZ48_04595, partial [Candidatus Uhrbacteria bacterium]|nr:hypothetical protein [Candidatus Uhrbacteria bacterium]
MIAGIIFSFIIGIVLGSFLNVLVIRVQQSSSLWGRSRCRACDRVIRPQHLVPIFSWILLKGRCADCKKPIHIQYPLVELLAGCLVVLVFVRHPFFSPGEMAPFIFECLFGLNLLFLAVFDWRWKLLPIEWMIGSLIVFGGFALLIHEVTILNLLIGFLVGFGFLGMQYALSKGRWIGGGDPWLGGLIGAVLGWPLIIVSLFLTYLIGAIVALVLLATGCATRKTRIAFGPLLVAGALLALW